MNLEKPHPLSFVFPEDWNTQATGGNLYDRFLVKALTELGVHVRVASYEEALYAARSSLLVFDSIFLPYLPEYLRQAHPPTYLLLHYFPSLQPELEEPLREELRRVEEFVLGEVDGAVVNSEFSRTVAAGRGADKRLLEIIPPALCVEPDDEARRRDGVHALMVANLTRGKGVLEFLEELTQQLLPENAFQLMIAGRRDLDPEYAVQCERSVASEPGLAARVTFAGGVPADQLRQLYRGSNLMVSASGMESNGMALHEARAFGLPILTLDAGNCAAHVRDGFSGYIFADVQKLAESFLSVCGNAQLHARLLEGAGEMKKSEFYTWRDAAICFLDFVTPAQSRSHRTPDAHRLHPLAATSDHPPFRAR